MSGEHGLISISLCKPHIVDIRGRTDSTNRTREHLLTTVVDFPLRGEINAHVLVLTMPKCLHAYSASTQFSATEPFYRFFPRIKK